MLRLLLLLPGPGFLFFNNLNQSSSEVGLMAAAIASIGTLAKIESIMINWPIALEGLDFMDRIVLTV
jgi:hypothetical protein